MIQFPGDDQRADSTGQSFGAFFGSGGVERFSAIDAGTISVTNISATNISSGTLNADRIGADSITATHIAANAVTASEINANAVTAGKIAANAIESSNIQAGQVKAANIETGTITATQIAAGTITATEIATGTITADQIASNTLSTSELNFITGDANSLSVSGLTSTYLDAGNGGVSPSTPGFIVWPDGCSFTSSGNNGIYYHTGFNNYDIYDIRDGYANNWYNRCEVAEGIDPFEVMESFEAEDEEKSSSKKWKKINHGKLHPSIYKKTKVKRTILEEGKLVESETEVEAYSLNKLVEFQRQAILQLKQEIENLKKAPNV